MASTGKTNKKVPRLHKAKVVVVRTEWNAGIVDELNAGCMRLLEKESVRCAANILVPGAFEIPFTIRQYWEHCKKNKASLPEAFIALGCVIRGDTPHFDYVCKAVTDGILQLNLNLPVPVIFGVLTVDNEQQARERTGGIHGHKGEEAAATAIRMIGLKRSFCR
jgi:6,7-dimethyl-8-ribityllumazine synthase